LAEIDQLTAELTEAIDLDEELDREVTAGQTEADQLADQLIQAESRLAGAEAAESQLAARRGELEERKNRLTAELAEEEAAQMSWQNRRAELEKAKRDYSMLVEDLKEAELRSVLRIRILPSNSKPDPAYYITGCVQKFWKRTGTGIQEKKRSKDGGPKKSWI